MYTIYCLKSIDGIKLRLKCSVRTAGSVKLEELRREVAESFASRRQGGSRGKKRELARLVNLEKLLEHNTVKISGPNRSVKVTEHFTCISTDVIYCITCTLCKKIYLGETARRLADRFRKHLTDVEKKQHRSVQTSRAPF